MKNPTLFDFAQFERALACALITVPNTYLFRIEIIRFRRRSPLAQQAMGRMKNDDGKRRRDGERNKIDMPLSKETFNACAIYIIYNITYRL